MSTKTKQKKARPFLKWAGGKTQLLGDITEFYPENLNKFYEPFVGGGAVFFHLNPSSAHINDVNEKLIHAYKNIKNNVDKLINLLGPIEEEFLAMNDEDREEYFYKKRDEFNSTPTDDIRKTVLLIFLNKTCFNGMYRENSSGEFNVPFGRYVNPTILDKKNLLAVSEALKGVKLTSLDFERSVSSAKKGDFVYFDPPYYPLNETSNFTGYHKSAFLDEEHTRLRDTFKKLDKKGCKVLLSNSYTPFVKELYKDFNQHKVGAKRSINSDSDGRGEVNELLITNY